MPSNGTGQSVERTLTPFGQLLKDLRMASGKSQVAIAKAAGVSPGYIGLMETGTRGNKPSQGVVRRIAQALDVNLADTDLLMQAAGWLRPGQSLFNTEQPSTREIILADPLLSEEQATILLGVYENMVRSTDKRP